jgi:hypothetical protein
MRRNGIIVVVLLPACVFPFLLCSEVVASSEPNAADLVRAVRESENWIHKVDSFQLQVKSIWTTPTQPVRSKTENRPTFSRNSQLYKSGTKDFLEFAFNSEYIRYQSGGDDKYSILRIWDGEKTISHEQSPKTNEEHYYLSAETEQLFETMFYNISWLRSQPHSFWFCQKDVNDQIKYFGYPEEFVLTDTCNFQGVDCYVLDWKPAKGLYAAPDISFRWYVGIKDKHLYGLVTLQGDQVDVNHYLSNYREVAPDCWFPMKQSYEIYEPDREGKYYLKTRRDMEIAKIQVNEKLHREMFQIELKEGVEVIDNRSGQRIKYIYKAPLIGKVFPSLKVTNINLDHKKVADKLMLFCFFDIEQRPSRNYLRQLNKKSDDLKEKNVVVLAIHASKIQEKTLNEWVKKNNIPFLIGIIEDDEEKTRFNWGIKSLPWLILTDHEHIVTAEGFGLDELDTMIKELKNEEI